MYQYLNLILPGSIYNFNTKHWRETYTSTTALCWVSTLDNDKPRSHMPDFFSWPYLLLESNGLTCLFLFCYFVTWPGYFMTVHQGLTYKLTLHLCGVTLATGIFLSLVMLSLRLPLLLLLLIRYRGILLWAMVSQLNLTLFIAISC